MVERSKYVEPCCSATKSIKSPLITMPGFLPESQKFSGCLHIHLVLPDHVIKTYLYCHNPYGYQACQGCTQ